MRGSAWTPLARRLQVVLVLGVLAVEQLRRDDQRCVAGEHGHLEGQHHEVALGHRDHPGGVDLDPLARRRAPDDRAPQHAVAEVEGALVVLEVGGADDERLVVDVELHQLGVRRVDEGLAGSGEPVGRLGVPDRPGLVQPVDVGAVLERVPALLGVAAHPDVAVRDREQGLGDAEVAAVGVALDQAPGVDGEPAAVEGVGRRLTALHARSPRSVTTRVAPAAVSVSAPAPRSTPMTRPNPPAAPARTPETASSTTTERAGVVPHSVAAWTKVSGAGLPASPSCGGDPAVDHGDEPVGQPRGVQHGGGVRRRRDDRERHPQLAQRVEEGDRTGVGGDAVAGEHDVEGVVLAVAEPADGVRVRRVGRVAVGQPDAARREQVAHALVAGLAVDVGEVVGVGVGRGVGAGGVPGGQEGVEHLRPGAHVDLGGGRQHAVEVEQDRVVLRPGHRHRCAHDENARDCESACAISPSVVNAQRSGSAAIVGRRGPRGRTIRAPRFNKPLHR